MTAAQPSPEQPIGERWRWYGLLLPQTYTGGIVDADLFHRIRAIRGSFFQSQIPDVFSGYAICSSVDEYLTGEAPFAIAGRSSHSIGAALFTLKPTAFLDEGLIPFHADFPMPPHGTLAFSMPAIVFETYLQADYLHHRAAEVPRQYMLELVMAESRHAPDVARDWGRQFAERHGLDYAAALAASRRFHWGRRSAALRTRLRNLWRRAPVYRGDPRPLGDVYEAAQTADAILHAPPNRLAEMARGLRRTTPRRHTV